MANTRLEVIAQQTTVATTATTRVFAVGEDTYSNWVSGDAAFGCRFQLQSYDTVNNNTTDYMIGALYDYVGGVLTNADPVTIYNIGTTLTISTGSTDDTLELFIAQPATNSTQYSVTGYIYVCEET